MCNAMCKLVKPDWKQNKTLVLSDPISRQTNQSAKAPFFGRATWFEEAAVERGGLGKGKEQGDLEDPQNHPSWDL